MLLLARRIKSGGPEYWPGTRLSDGRDSQSPLVLVTRQTQHQVPGRLLSTHRRSDPGRASDPLLGLHAPGGDRVGECRVVAFGLVGIGLAEFRHGLVEGV